MNTPEILHGIFKYQPSPHELTTVLYDAIAVHEKGRETSLFPPKLRTYDLTFWSYQVRRKYEKFLKRKVNKERVYGSDQTKLWYNVVIPDHQKKSFPYEWYHDLKGKAINKEFWYAVYRIDSIEI